MWIREPIFILLWWASTEVQKIVCPSPAGWTEDCACQWSALRWVTAPVDDIVRSDRQCCLHILISIITIITAIAIIIVTNTNLGHEQLKNHTSSICLLLFKWPWSKDCLQIEGWSYTLNLHIMYQAHFQLRTPVHQQVWTRHPQVSS